MLLPLIMFCSSVIVFSRKYPEHAIKPGELTVGTFPGSLFNMLTMRNAEVMTAHDDVSPEQIHGRSIVIDGMLATLDNNAVPKIDSVMELCKFFDAGECHAHISLATLSSDLQKQLEAKHPGLRIRKDPKQEDKSPEAGLRTIRYANLRNALLQESLSLGTDYVMMADLEGNVKWNERTLGVIINALKPENEGKWDGVSFLGTRYYDWWAVRCNATSTNCWKDEPATCFMRQPYFSCIEQAQAIQNSSGFLQIDSAFDGFAIYKTAAIGNCRYEGRDPGGDHATSPMGPQDCEHVAFNRCLKKAGKRFMLNTGVAEVAWLER